MNKLISYTARDRRVYNGALCSDMRKERNHTKRLDDQMKEIDPTASCTYFPIEGKYLVFTNSNILENPDLVGPPRVLTNNFHIHKQDALIEAIKVLGKNNEETKIILAK